MRVPVEDIVAAYRTILGRTPNAAEVKDHFDFGYVDRVALLQAFVASPEFEHRFAAARSRELPAAPDAGLVSVAGMTRPATIFLGDRVLTYTHRNQRIYVPPTDIDLAPHLFSGGSWEGHVEQAILRQVPVGGQVIDIGANIGYHSLALANAVGPSGRVDAFEANPSLIPLLRATFFTNGLHERIRLHHCAVTDTAGTLELAQEPEHFGSGNLVPPGHEATAAYHHAYSVKYQVPANPLDALFADDAAPCQAIRLDIEGSEPQALRGGAALIARSPDLSIITEWSVGMMSARADVAAFVAWLEGQGFRFWIIEPGGDLRPVTPPETLNLPHSDLLIRRQEPR